ncbi:acyltransferase family protein [Piscinibacter sakaiensis]|uniref:Acyltransferase 3 n=1 Tax=Piscinibacter sakaiensis TaxID=1547922 RepID=A0A0K8P320_PISS1|nr:SGNH hydrolase domain-containing protein [Piscinibacter sakaiensis]GAP37008.1 acyltransferase 3 [Piscinibacter sakaiensis]
MLATLAYDRQRAFPGPAALLPTLGTALVLLAARPGGWVARGLSIRPLVALGLVSYGAYLWHQPLLALQRYASEAPPSVGARAGALLLALACAAASWRLLEAPLRRAQGRSPGRFWRGLLAAALLVGGLAVLLWHSGGWPMRWSEPQRQVLALGERPYAEAYREGHCFLRADQPPAAHAAGCPDAAVDGGLAVWGDSHAAALAAGLRGLAGTGPLRQYTASGCPPLAEAATGLPPNCRAFSHAVGEALRRRPPARLLLHARWSDHAGAVDEAARPAALRALQAALPGTRILLLGPVPRWYPTLPLHLARGPEPWTAATEGPDAGAAADGPLERRLAGQAAAAGVDYRSLRALACPAGPCRQVVGAPGQEAPLVWDEAHLTPEGAAWLARALVPTLP